MDTSVIRTLLWLRWRLTRNQWSRSGTLNAVLATIVMAAAAVIGATGGLVGLVGGFFVSADTRPQTLLVLWDVLFLAFLFVWMIGLVSEIQRSETIDIGRLLHFPISLKQVFFINYVASHATLSIVVFVPGMLGLCLGLTIGQGWWMLGMLPLVIGLLFMVTAWTYCLRGWLVTLMTNPRRRRMVIAVITFGFIFISQLPNFLGQFAHGFFQSMAGKPVEMDVVLLVHRIIPFLWAGGGAMSLAGGNPWPALGGSAGAWLLGWAYGGPTAPRFASIRDRARARLLARSRRALASRPLRISWSAACLGSRKRPLRWAWRPCVP
jgi:hypothetical protein